MSLQLRNGLIAGLLGSLAYITALQVSIGNTLNPIVNGNILGVFISLLIMLILTLLQKKRIQQDELDFSDAMKTGLAVTVLSGLIISISLYVYFKWINPDWFTMQSVFWKKAGKTVPPKISPSQLSVYVMFVNNIPGAVMTLILSLILKTRK